MIWEYAVLVVRVKKMSPHWLYEAKAWVDETQIYAEELTDMYWSKPMTALGRDGWELVGVVTENAVMGSGVEDWIADTSRPVQANFFFKRPKAG